MARDKAGEIQRICGELTCGGPAAAAAAIADYPFIAPTKVGRGYSTLAATRVFVRDGFIDRYSGARLVHPAVLRVISKLLPQEFPFHNNWKITETHPAYWELVPTIDHIVPVARGGANAEDNWLTTSMLRNAAKANWTLEELGWSVLPAGKFAEWDGLTQWLVDYIAKNGGEGQDPYVLRWYSAACTVCGLTPRPLPKRTKAIRAG